MSESEPKSEKKLSFPDHLIRTVQPPDPNDAEDERKAIKDAIDAAEESGDPE